TWTRHSPPAPRTRCSRSPRSRAWGPSSPVRSPATRWTASVLAWSATWQVLDERSKRLRTGLRRGAGRAAVHLAPGADRAAGRLREARRVAVRAAAGRLELPAPHPPRQRGAPGGVRRAADAPHPRPRARAASRRGGRLPDRPPRLAPDR